MGGDNSAEATLTCDTKFLINDPKLYVPVVTLSPSNNIKFSEHLKQGF